MTVAALTPSKDYIENGSTTDFAVPFRFADPTHIKARRIAVDGTVTEMAYGSDYSVTGGTTDAGGTLTTMAPAASGVRLAIRRETPRDQTMTFETNDTFPAKSNEGVLDKQMLVSQEIDVAAQDTRDRAPLVPVGQVAPPLLLTGLTNGDLLEYRDGKLLKKDLSAYAGQYAALDGNGQIVGVAGSVPSGVPALAEYIAIDGTGNAQQAINALALGIFDNAGSATIPPAIERVRTSGHSVLGAGAAEYRYDPDVDATFVSNNPRSAFISANGRGFRLGEREPDAAMFGALADDGGMSPPDATAALNDLAAYYEDAGSDAQIFSRASGLFKLPPGLTLRISGTIHLPWFMAGALNGARIVPIDGTALSAFDNDAMININVDGSGTQLKQGAGLKVPRLENFELWNNSSPTGITPDPIVEGLKGIYSKSRVCPRNFSTNSLWQTFIKAGSSGTEYIDGIGLEDIVIYGARGSEYQIVLQAFGDNVEVSNVIFQISPDNPKGIYARYCRGGKFRRVINGAHLFERCLAVDISAFHLERGTIALQSVGGKVHGNFFYNRDNVPFIDVGQYDGNTIPPPLRIEDNVFAYNIPNASDAYVPDDYDPDNLDINISANRAAVKVGHNVRALIPATTFGITTYTAAKVGVAGTELPAWKNNPAWNARGADIMGYTVNPGIRSQPVASAVNNATNSTTNNVVWNAPSATYYYRWLALFGPIDRRVGRVFGGGELSAALTNGGNGRLVNVSTGTPEASNPGFSGMTMWGIRGTATGSYSHEVFAGLVGGTTLTDAGYCLGTGEQWQAISGGPIALPSVNTNVLEIRLLGNGNVWIKAPAPPSYGTWLDGDYCENSAPTVDGNNMMLVGWRCAGGTPGTWTPQYVSTVSPAT